MKMSLISKILSSAVLFLVTASLTGCRTEPAFDNSKAAMQPPAKQTETAAQPAQPVPAATAQPALDDSKVALEQSNIQKEPALKQIVQPDTPPTPSTTEPSFSGDTTANKQTSSQTAQVIDWNNRIGNYTYNQAVTELGIPNRKARLSNGKVVSKWFVQPPVGPRFNSGMSYYGNTGFGANQRVGSSYNNRVLQLTFGTNGVLAAWSKNY
jgi:hypothetical protein